MNRFYILAGLCLLIIPLIVLKSKISEDLMIEKYGKLVEMKIIDKPSSCLGTKVKWFMKVEYQGSIYSKQISGNYCEEHKIGDIVKLRYLQDYERVLMPDESTLGDIFAGLFISLVALLSIFYGIRKQSRSKI